MIIGAGLFFCRLFATREWYPIRRRCNKRALLQAISARQTIVVTLVP